jgi:hypothetical protein
LFTGREEGWISGRVRTKSRERQGKAIEMYKAGAQLEEITAKLGYVHDDYVRGLLKQRGLLRPEDQEKAELDVPKVLALKRAGWSMVKIADEFENRFTVAEINMEVAKYKEGRR